MSQNKDQNQKGQEFSQEFKSNEISLEDIDKILAEDDPGFSLSLQDLHPDEEAAAELSGVEIELLELDEKTLDEGENVPDETEKLAKVGLKVKISALGIRTYNALRLSLDEAGGWLKLRPKEFLFYILSLFKASAVSLRRMLSRFASLPWSQQLLFFSFVMIFLGGIFIISMNLKGRWVPSIDRPLIADYSQVADRSWDASQERWVPLFQALRQPEYRYLFDKVVVNLKRNEGIRESNPMGMFEFYVELDSKATAVEVGTRRLELSDLVQRTVEGETYQSLVGEAGKQRLKNLIRQELNEVLSSGWVKEVYISNMVLKP